MRTRQRQARKLWALGTSTVLGLALGCADDSTSPTTEDFANARAEAKQRVVKQAEAPAPAPAPVLPVVTQGGIEQLITDYNYDPTGKRDPFRSFTWDRPDRLVPLAEAGPLEQFDLSQLEVVAVVWRTGNARALVQDPSGESYIIAEGTAIGKNQGHVISIDDNAVVVKETYVDYLGQETTKDIEMSLRRNEGG